eukprot:g41816.t1
MAFKWFWWLLGISERTITGALATTEMRNLHHDGPRITMQEILVILVLLLCIKIRTERKKKLLMLRLLCLLLLGSSREWSKAYLTQDVLQGLAESPWKKIYDTKDEKALLQIEQNYEILKPSTVERYEQRKTFSEERIKELKILHSMVTSVRQSAEWGMGSLQKQFPRITLPLPHNADKRALVLECCFRLYNFRNRMGGRNQIRTSFDPAWILELNFACV